MTRFVERHPAWALIVIIAIAVALWLIFAVWPQGLEEAIGRKRVFLNAVFNGITLGGLYFLVASGFTLIFGLMRNVNLAHGSLYLFGGYVGYAISASTGSWVLSFIVAFILTALVGVLLQVLVFRRMEGQDLRQTMVTIGLSIVFADLMLWACGGDFYQIQTPNWLDRTCGAAAGHRDQIIRRAGLSALSLGPARDLRRLRRDRRGDVAGAQPHAHRHDHPRRR
ncbi:ABC-type branched-subunit amino acid transport system permease subunit [Bradyrhizobium sp. LB7.2]